ncbi:MAG: HAMP domain-containing protein, partial [Rhodoferax sp.]|nr:HAMP domain-containing protein [Rhodoferax sp.]
MFLRVFGAFGGLLLAMTVLYGLLMFPLQLDSLLKVMYSQAASVSRSIIQANSEAMLSDDYGVIVEHSLQVLKNNKSIQLLVLAPKRGKPIRITPAGWVMQENDAADLSPASLANETYGIVQDSAGVAHYRYRTPIRMSGVQWGTLQIDFDTSAYEENINAVYKQLFSISILVLLAILPVGYFFTLWLIRPIVNISQAASRVALGDLNAHVDARRNDEIGQLSRSFNHMVHALQQSRYRVQNHHQELERKVAERTQELAELNQTLDQRVRDEIDMLNGAGEEFDPQAILAGQQTPVFFGSAKNNFGVQLLLDHYLALSTGPQAHDSSAGMIDSGPENEKKVF